MTSAQSRASRESARARGNVLQLGGACLPRLRRLRKALSMTFAPTLDWLVPLVGWPLMLLVAWLAGEALFGRTGVPRVCAYGVVGLAFGAAGLTQGHAPGDMQGGASQAALSVVANAALALTLFELGYRVNPRWFRHNPWVLAAGIVQALGTFAAVLWLGGVFAVAPDQRLVLAALCVATSPAAVMRVTQELRSAGQVTERLLHLCALNCLMAVLLLKGVAGYWHLYAHADIARAAFDSVYVVALSLASGALFGVLAPWLTRIATSAQSTTVTFAVLVLLLTGIGTSLHLSPLLAALAFGAVARERRVLLSAAQRNFGTLGDVLGVFLFVFIGSLLAWRGWAAGLAFGAAVLALRSCVHVTVNVALARASGTTFAKGALTGLALMPMSAFALLLLEESRRFGLDIAADGLPAIAALLVLLEVLGPLATQRALRWANEAGRPGR